MDIHALRSERFFSNNLGTIDMKLDLGLLEDKAVFYCYNK